LQAQLHELERLPVLGNTEQVALGSFVHTEHDRYFIAIGIGYVEVGGMRCAVISPASPIGQALLGKRIGEGGSVNGRSFTVQGIG
jgi:transcription elongation GreA/GreB family factor